MHNKIEFRSIEDFEADYKKEINSQSEQLIQDHLWWNYPLTLYDKIEYPHHLTGDCHILHYCLSDEYGVKNKVNRPLKICPSDLLVSIISLTRSRDSKPHATTIK